MTAYLLYNDVSTQLERAIRDFVNSTTGYDYAIHTGYIVQDYAALVEATQQVLPSQIAKLEEQLATLKAKQSAWQLAYIKHTTQCAFFWKIFLFELSGGG